MSAKASAPSVAGAHRGIALSATMASGPTPIIDWPGRYGTIPAWLPPLGLISLVTLVLRWESLGNPVFGFDEQFYLLVAGRMWHGALPYVDIWDRKPLGLFLVYALAFVPGGNPFLGYQLLATATVIATSWLIRRAALRTCGPFGATLAALLYPVWCNFADCAGGQSPVFYNLPMLAAAVLTERAIADQRALGWRGVAVMALGGLALQIKYTVVFELVFLGVVLLWHARQRGAAWLATGRWGLTLVAVAWAPTLGALAFYAARGQAHAFLFANFLSIFGRIPDPWTDQVVGLLAIAAAFSPLLAFAWLAWKMAGAGRATDPAGRAGRFTFRHGWALAAIGGFLGFGAFLSPSTAMPVVPPLCLLAAPFLDAAPRRGRVLVVGAFGLLSLLTLHVLLIGRGGAAEAERLAAAARPSHGGCIWVWDGYPALYLLTNSCVPTRWAFPGHLNTADEARAAAIDTDPTAEVRRILASRPESIIDDSPAYDLGNKTTRALVMTALARDYHLVARVQTGTARYRLVYRRN